MFDFQYVRICHLPCCAHVATPILVLNDQKGSISFNFIVPFLQEHLNQIATDSKVEYYDFTCEVHTENPRTVAITNASAALVGKYSQAVS